MNRRKTTNILIGIWGITTALIFIGLIAQMALPKVFKNAKYMEMLFDVKQSIILGAIALIVLYVLIFVFTTNVESVKNYANKVRNKKPIMMLAMIVSIVFCLMFILIDYSTIASSVITSNNVKTLDGKVEKIQTKSLTDSGKTVTMVSVVDSNGERHKMVPNSNVHFMSVFKDSKVHFDYVDNTISSSKGKVDGTILGYDTVAGDEVKKYGEKIDGILK
ncbi:hypothetical protein ACF91D_28565 [Staphylococcus sp. 231237_7MaSpsaltlick]|uniref:hypothetical protein n=1 Tax=Staphylococcus TaxID=1279 RepID=UPI00370B8B1D